MVVAESLQRYRRRRHRAARNRWLRPIGNARAALQQIDTANAAAEGDLAALASFMKSVQEKFLRLDHCWPLRLP